MIEGVLWTVEKKSSTTWDGSRTFDPNLTFFKVNQAIE